MYSWNVSCALNLISTFFINKLGFKKIRKFKRWWSAIRHVSTKTNTHLSPQFIEHKNGHWYLALEIHVLTLDRHTHVTGLNFKIWCQAFLLVKWISQYNTDVIKQDRFPSTPDIFILHKQCNRFYIDSSSVSTKVDGLREKPE